MNFGNNNLQDEALAKDRARIQLKKDVNEQRRLRILKAKTRLIGLDVQALDAQVAERNAKKADEMEMERYECEFSQCSIISALTLLMEYFIDIMTDLKMREVQALLEQVHEDEQQMKQRQMDELKRSWEESMFAKSQIKEESNTIDRDNAGMSSALRFVGEDFSKEDRTRRQQEQMRRWAEQQLAEKAAARHHQKDEDDLHAGMMMAVDQIRGLAEREEWEMRRSIQAQVNEENDKLMEAHRERNKKNVGSIDDPTSLDVFDEDQTKAWDENGRIIRRDAFKGFTDAQRRRIQQENEMALMEKRERDELEKELDRDWTKQQNQVQRFLEQSHKDEMSMRGQQKQHHLELLRKQAEEEAQRRMQERADKYGAIDNKFFEYFGKSAR